VRSFLPSENIGALLNLERSASGRAAVRRAPVVVNDYPRQGDPNSPAGRLGIRAGVAVPLLHEGRLLGTLSVSSFHDRRLFQPEDATTLENLAGIGASALVGIERRQLEGALTLRNEVLAEVSHDLRTPITAALVQLELLRREADRPEARAERLTEGLARLEASVGKMASLVDQLQDVARLEAGQPLQLHRAPVDLVCLVTDAAQAHEPSAPRHTLRVHAGAPEIVGQWDAARLGRVLDNLISNAVKYSPSGGEVSIMARLETDWAVLSVGDQGVGIPATDLPKVFERFYRGRNVAGRVRGSGLAGARQIVEQHGGTLSVESVEGEGSTFTVRLPVG